MKNHDGTQTLRLTIEALPIGAILSDGSHTFTATSNASTADITGWKLGKLRLTPAKDYTGKMNLNIVATATQLAKQTQAKSEARLTVTVLPGNGEDDKSARIIVHSKPGHAHGQDRDEDHNKKHYLTLNPVPVSRIDWNGRLPEFGPLKEMDWVEEWGRNKPQEKSLAERTGLSVRVER